MILLLFAFYALCHNGSLVISTKYYAMKSLMQILAVAAHWVFIKLGMEVKY